tara:strand:- start:1926 stop:2078 length:153 start_codon:yes stop_codon:yes gene_type:complete
MRLKCGKKMEFPCLFLGFAQVILSVLLRRNAFNLLNLNEKTRVFNNILLC